MCRITILILATTVLAAAATAQQTLAPEPAGWRVPIHTADDDPIGGPYGIWAVGAGYKVSFHDGFAFYPYLGADYPENLPLRWRTLSITIGGEPVTDTAAASSCASTAPGSTKRPTP